MTTAADPVARPLLVAEYFGPTLQGEGSSTGKLALFIRLSRCNLSCPGCDTPYTWDWTRFNSRHESRRIATNELRLWVMSQPAKLVVITGGEPMLQQQALVPLVRSLVEDGRRIEIETNGTVIPGPELLDSVTQFNVSPKTATFAGKKVAQSTRINPGALRVFTASGKAIFKFVVSHKEELSEIARYEEEFDLTPLWVMPEGTTRETVLDRMPWLADEAVRRNWNLSTRLHILLWGDQRGR
ncbi:7-carboxy-7-deazaguanine synthase QueE [Amycolatopsis sp. K13G38]|uniref:7-carboxy-7-deazaguanine synthase n=1 Tax=Amycolatopsis acididurans TaxID=2724524 RepID=A0ABX1JB47_9PSEU|nr:7-carboxy-7-deazaguanine synthase QueE [Amycolatopsis acididurans]NKQ55585.1 7-carboxy-7-deazaguanine synthase QueE [Amycolatopsis acididurans]